MAGITLTIDPTSENAANTPLVLNNQTTHWLTATEFPPPAEKVQWSTSVDSEGGVPIAGAHENRSGTVAIRIHGTSASDIEGKVLAVSRKVEKCRREGGTLQATLPSGNSYVLDILAGSVGFQFDRRFIANWRADLTWTFTAKPYWRGEEITTITDDFSTDTIANYTFTAGTGTISVSGGQLVPSSTVQKRFYRTGLELYDPRVTLKYTTDNPLTTPAVRVIVKRIDDNNRIVVVRAATSLEIFKVVAGVATSIASVTGLAALSTSTSYWLRGKIDGNDITAEHWTTNPATAGNTPASSVSYTLTGAEATTFGENVAGNVGIDVTPGSTSWRYDDLIVDPWARAERTLPALVFSVRGVPGDVPALGKLEVINESTADWWFLMWGLQSRYMSTASTAKLFYEAEDLTPLGTAAVSATLNSTASGAGTNDTVLAGDLTTTYQAILSTQLTGGGSHLSHVGDYRVWARVYCPTGNTGDVKLALEWGEGDFRRFTRNAVWSMDSTWEGSWRLVDLGIVHLSEAVQGAQRWEARVLAKSTVAGDDVHVDCMFLTPVTEGYGEAKAMWAVPSPTSYIGRDEFEQSAGSLTGKTAAAGGTWAGAGDTDDFSINTSADTAERTVTNDSTADYAGRFAISGASALAAQAAQIDVTHSTAQASPFLRSGIVLRYVDANNFALVSVYYAGTLSQGRLSLTGKVSGISYGTSTVFVPWEPTTSHTLIASADVDGRIRAWFVPTGAPIGAASIDFTPGITLANGKPGFYDQNGAGLATTRSYDNFVAWVPTVDAAAYAGQALQLRHNAVIRENDDAGGWSNVSDYRGRYLVIPPGGSEERASRIIVNPSRSDPDIGADSAIDDITARLSVTPRYLNPGE